MTKKPHGSDLIAGAHTLAQIERREEQLNKTRQALSGRTLFTSELATELGVSRRRAYALVALLVAQGEASSISPKDNIQGNQWHLVDEPQDAAPRMPARLPLGYSQRTKVVKATQMGIPRHWMDVALFGPAGAAA